jgi:alpha-tubulin suppressor-like RCC1 family protein
LAIKTDGTLWGHGGNGNGQVGDSTITDRSSPVQIGSLTKWLSVAAGSYFSLAVSN